MLAPNEGPRSLPAERARTQTSVTRVSVYEAWRAAASAAIALRAALDGRGPAEHAAAAYTDLASLVVDLRARLPLGAAVLLPALVPVPAQLGPAHVDAVDQAQRELAELLADAAPVRVEFASDALAPAIEQRLLAAAVELVPPGRSNASVAAPALAERARVTIRDARRAICRWLDDGVVGLPAAGSPLQADEIVFLLEPAYERARTAAGGSIVRW